MGVVRYKLEKVTGSEDKDGPKYQVEYLVTVDDPNDHTHKVLSQMPWKLGNIYHIGNDLDVRAIALSATAEPVPKNNYRWKYIVDFGVRPEGETLDNPFDDSPQIELVFAAGEKLLERDIHGKPIRNTVGDRFDDVLTREDSQPILRVTRNEPRSQVLFGMDLRDTINRSPWQGAARRTVKFQPPTARSRFHKDVGLYYEKSYEFKFSDDTWRFILLNQGYYEKGEPDSEGKPSRIRIRDDNGDEIAAPMALGKKGKILKETEPAYWIEFDGYNESMFPNWGQIL